MVQNVLNNWIRNRIFWTIIAFALLLLGVFLSQQSPEESIKFTDTIMLKLGLLDDRQISEHGNVYIFYRSLFRETMHMVMYMIGTIPLLFLFRIHFNRNKMSYAYVFLCVFTYACLDELGQGLLAGRDMQIIDVMMDMVGATLAILIFMIVRGVVTWFKRNSLNF